MLFYKFTHFFLSFEWQIKEPHQKNVFLNFNMCVIDVEIATVGHNVIAHIIAHFAYPDIELRLIRVFSTFNLDEQRVGRT